MLRVDIINNNSETRLSQHNIDTTVADTLKTLGINEDLIIEIEFVDSGRIKELNNQYRGIDKPTDVLSFPQTPTPGNNINILGAIIISPEIVEQKKERMEDVIKHGLLHLLGFDHEVEEKAWEEAADKIGCQL
jgi:probable rRNA maturation factor